MRTADKMEESYWGHQDTVEYSYIRLRYQDRKALLEEMAHKKKVFDATKPADPHYQRIAMSSEMARLRADMAYIVGENDNMRELIDTMRDLHDQMGILRGAYSHVKLLADRSQIDYKLIHKAIEEMLKLKGEITNGTTKRSDGADGQKSELLPGQAG